MEVLTQQVERFGYLFYVASPNATTFWKEEEIPNYVNDVVPQFIAMLLIEVLVLRVRNSYKMPLSDMMVSVGHGIVYTVIGSLTRGVELVGYQWLYQRRVLDLDWSSPVTWWTAAVGVDLAYYWYHRLVHEVSLGWAAHQVHHSSEEYNLTTALRQSLFQKFFSFGMYLPLAYLGVPLTALLVHLQFNLLYQFWIHTEAVTTLGPLEWVLNTPSHHRVHHGSNPWCLDKNYAGVLIIWDRMFGTFEPERIDEKIIYGLVDQPQTSNIPYLQVFYYRDLVTRIRSQASWSDSFRSIIYGPGWTPGSPRLGHPMPDITMKPREKYRPHLPLPIEIYLVGHFLVSLIIQQTLMANFDHYSYVSVLCHIAYLLVSLGNIGAMYDGWKWAGPLEIVRCIVYLVTTSYFPLSDSETINGITYAYSAASAVFWALHTILSIFFSVNILKDNEDIKEKVK